MAMAASTMSDKTLSCHPAKALSWDARALLYKSAHAAIVCENVHVVSTRGTMKNGARF